MVVATLKYSNCIHSCLMVTTVLVTCFYYCFARRWLLAIKVTGWIRTRILK